MSEACSAFPQAEHERIQDNASQTSDVSPGRSGTLASEPSRRNQREFDPQTLERLVKGGVSSAEARKGKGGRTISPLALARGEISYARSYCEGERYIDGLSIDDVEKDRLAVDFAASLSQVDEGELWEPKKSGWTVGHENRRGESESSDDEERESGRERNQGELGFTPFRVEGLQDIPNDL